MVAAFLAVTICLLAVFLLLFAIFMANGTK